MMMAGIKEEFEQYVRNAELGPYIEDKCTQYLSVGVHKHRVPIFL
jgi:hypothetical protein